MGNIAEKLKKAKNKISLDRFLYHPAETRSITEEECQKLFEKQFCLTPRESEVFEKLITTEDNVQEIADTLYISRRNLQRHIASVYQKTETKSRIGLLQSYTRFMLKEKNIK